MNVAELIEQLYQYPPEMPVRFAYQYGDHWRTIVTPEVDLVEQGTVRGPVAYYNSHVLVDEEDADESSRRYESNGEAVEQAVLLRHW